MASCAGVCLDNLLCGPDRCVSVSVDQSQVGKSVVLISVTDVNDNAPSFATEYQTFVCERAQLGQVSLISLSDPQILQSGSL